MDFKTVFTIEIDDHDCHNTELLFCEVTSRLIDETGFGFFPVYALMNDKVQVLPRAGDRLPQNLSL